MYSEFDKTLPPPPSHKLGDIYHHIFGKRHDASHDALGKLYEDFSIHLAYRLSSHFGTFTPSYLTLHLGIALSSVTGVQRISPSRSSLD